MLNFKLRNNFLHSVVGCQYGNSLVNDLFFSLAIHLTISKLNPKFDSCTIFSFDAKMKWMSRLPKLRPTVVSFC